MYELPDFSQSIAAMVEEVAHLENEITSMTATDIIFNMPCEISFVDQESEVMNLKLSSPLQRTETSILPVLHHIKIHFSMNEHD